ncbi:metal-dependent hydrolase [Halobacterium noricense]|uniref:metal-dependent hydrolase n=1 Tax=Halobacterium noricense TaxID=223182 RepID=UPI001E3D48B5|nr:metal-dependent hydrolase [Halobacterium noricense]UHH26993.1 metal-dependent hydrolase [Halobacterium noricense]
MFVGHGLGAFALVAFLATVAGCSRERAIQLGIVAGLFAFVPDVDIVYAPIGLLARSVQTVSPDVFWGTANTVHRGATHSIVIGAILAAAVAAWNIPARVSRIAAVGGFLSIIAIGAVVDGLVNAGVLVVYVATGLAIGEWARRKRSSTGWLFGAALIGLVSHPFGDLFTGGPADFLYPFDIVLVTSRIALHPDPTVHLLAVFLLELGTIWLAIVAYTRLQRISIRRLLRPRAVAGSGYAAAVFVIPTPTIHTALLFVFSILALAIVGVGIPAHPFARHRRSETLVTGLAAVTVGAIAYAAAYGTLG